MPTSHSLLVMYTTVVHNTGRRIRRVVAARRSVATESVTWRGGRLVLSSSAEFVEVPVEDAPRRSRFWQQVLAPEGSAAAWVNMFQVFEDVTAGDELMEISVACIVAFLTAALLAAILARQR